MAEELRKKVPYWHIPYHMEQVRLEPDGKPYDVQVDEEDRMYVVEDDGERTYLVFG